MIWYDMVTSYHITLYYHSDIDTATATVNALLLPSFLPPFTHWYCRLYKYTCFSFTLPLPLFYCTALGTMRASLLYVMTNRFLFLSHIFSYSFSPSSFSTSTHPSLYYTTLNHTTLHHTTLYHTIPHYTTLHHTTLHYTPMHDVADVFLEP